MPGPRRWNREESTARGSNDPPNQSRDQEYQSEDSEYDNVEYASRKRREFPTDMTLWTREFKEQEDHNQYSYGFRDECQWYQDSEVVKFFAKRGTLNISGPRDMSMFVK